MLKKTFLGMVVLATTTALSQAALAGIITVNVLPGNVPDEQEPRVVNTAPPGFGANAWQGPATGKSNWHARYLADGDVLSALFPDDAATLTINDIESISYWTNRTSGAIAGRDWWIQLYTRDDVEWYGDRYINNYGDHSNTDWAEHSTDSSWTWRRNGTKIGSSIEVIGDHDALQVVAGTDLVEMISVQTDSGWNGFDGYMDGLVITLTNGNVGRVNFVPEPGTMALLGASLLGLFGASRRRMKSA